MNKPRTLFFAILILIANFHSFGQETKLCKLWATGNDRVDLSLSYLNGQYHLNAQILTDEGYYINKGQEFSLITINNDTVSFEGLTEGHFVIYSGTAHQRLGTVLYTFTNEYLLNDSQVDILRSTLIARSSMEFGTNRKIMVLQTFDADVTQRLFKKLDKKLK